MSHNPIFKAPRPKNLGIYLFSMVGAINQNTEGIEMDMVMGS